MTKQRNEFAKELLLSGKYGKRVVGDKRKQASKKACRGKRWA